MKKIKMVLTLFLACNLAQGMNPPEENTLDNSIRISFQPRPKAVLLCLLVKNPQNLSAYASKSVVLRKVALLQEILIYITNFQAGWDELDPDFKKSTILLEASLLLLDTNRKTCEELMKPFNFSSLQIPALRHIVDTIIKNDWKKLKAFLMKFTTHHDREIPTPNYQDSSLHFLDLMIGPTPPAFLTFENISLRLARFYKKILERIRDGILRENSLLFLYSSLVSPSSFVDLLSILRFGRETATLYTFAQETGKLYEIQEQAKLIHSQGSPTFNIIWSCDF